METESPELLPAREGPGRLLRHRPDLAMHRVHRRRAREIAEGVGLRAAAVDVLASWLGTQPSLDTKDLEGALTDRLQLRLARTPPKLRKDADSPESRAEIALLLGWEQLRGSAPRELARTHALLAGRPCSAAFLEAASEQGRAALDDCVRAGFVVVGDSGLTMQAEIAAFCTKQAEPPTERPRRLARAAEALRSTLAGPVDGRVAELAEVVVDLAEREQWADVVGGLCVRLAQVARKRAQPEESLRWTERGLAHSAGRGFRAMLWAERSAVLWELDDTQGARQALQQARASIEGAAHEAPRGFTDSLTVLDLSMTASESIPAVPLLARVANIALSPSAPDEVAAPACHLAATLALRAGDLALARRYLDRLAPIVERLCGPEDPRRVPVLISQSQRLGADIAVEDLLEQARVLAGGDLDRPSSRTLPWVLHELGVRAADDGDHASAGTLFDEAAMLTTSLLGPQHRLKGLIARSRALLFLCLGEPLRASTTAQRAQEWIDRGGSDGERALTELVVALGLKAEGLDHDVPAKAAACLRAWRAERGDSNPAVQHLEQWLAAEG